MQLIILEGENKTGKSTIARLLVVSHGFEYVKCSQPKGDPYEEYMAILNNVAKRQRDTVIDRFTYGEFVYGPIYRGKSGLSDVQLRNLELKARSVADKVSLIYCFDEPSEIAKRFKEEKEEFATVKNIDRALVLYNRVIQRRLDEIPFDVYFHQMKGQDDITNNGALKELVEKGSTVTRSVRFLTAVGNTIDPKFVLVGDKHNDELKTGYQHLAQPFDFGVSAKYLFSEVKRAEVRLGEVMLINSNSNELKRLKKLPTYTQFIALGKNAEKRLLAAGISEFVPVGHPAYERRFHFGKHLIAKQLRQLS